MNKQDENELTENWHSDTNYLNEKIDDFFKRAQDHAYALGLARGLKEAAAVALAANVPLAPWPLAPKTGYYEVNGERVWLEKDEPLPKAAPAALAANVLADHVTVPVRPTQQMIDAALTVDEQSLEHDGENADPLDIYAAMLAAAPAPEADLLNGLTEAETSASPSVAGLTAPAQAQQPRLLPCPFCGSHVIAREGFHMTCLTCGAEGVEADEATDEAAAAAWNRRAKAKPEAQQPKGLTTERLRQMHHEDEFGLFCDFDEFEQIARAVEQEHSIGASGEGVNG